MVLIDLWLEFVWMLVKMGVMLWCLFVGWLFGMVVEGIVSGIVLVVGGVLMVMLLGIIVGILVFIFNVGVIVIGVLMVVVGFSVGVDMGYWVIGMYFVV